MSDTNKLLSNGAVIQSIVTLDRDGDVAGTSTIIIPNDCQMIEKSGEVSAGTNQVTQVVSINQNVNGIDIFSFYTQIIQAGAPGNICQSLLIAASSAPTNFASKLNAFPIFRTYQDEKQSPVALAGYAPFNAVNIRIPKNWGIWQIVSITGDTLLRNNMRMGLRFR